jgi:type I restriction enzyme R subunit
LRSFKAKARFFLRQHEDHIAVHKLRTNHQLPPTDLAELERMLRESGTGSAEDIERAKASAEGLGLFVRSLVGLDRTAAKQAFSAFMAGRALTANQIEFIDMIVEQLTESGVMDPARLYESPYTDLNDQGLDGLFPPEAADELVAVLEEVKRRAAA